MYLFCWDEKTYWMPLIVKHLDSLHERKETPQMIDSKTCTVGSHLRVGNRKWQTKVYVKTEFHCPSQAAGPESLPDDWQLMPGSNQHLLFPSSNAITRGITSPTYPKGQSMLTESNHSGHTHTESFLNLPGLRHRTCLSYLNYLFRAIGSGHMHNHNYSS